MKRVVVLVAMFTISCVANAQDIFTARVTQVTDGDTVQVTRDSGEIVRVRFGGIDTPETDQRGGAEATEALEALVLNRDVRVELTGKRSGSRMIGEIFLLAVGGAPEVDVSLELVRNGHAWWFWQFAAENEARARMLAEAEVEAKLKRSGLYADRDPIFPRVFRAGCRIPNEVVRPRPDLIDSEVAIVELLPDPNGQDSGNETITIGNGTSLNVSLDGWSVRDDDGGHFELNGSLEPNSRKVFTIRDPDSLVLGNSGDVVTLFDADGNPVQIFEYRATEPGVPETP